MALNCQYKDAEGLKCAVGCLIPDGEYKPELETGSLDWAVAFTPTLKKFDTRFLFALQNVHDSYSRHTESNWDEHIKAGMTDIRAKWLN